jgi:putative flippase GtrA
MRFQLTALLATTVDYIMTIFLKEVVQFDYRLAVFCGATAGAITAFTFNRYWVFRSLEKHPLSQALRYAVVAGGSVILNTAGTSAITEIFSLQYLVSKAIMSIIIGFTYSYYFSRRFVFYA